MLATAAVLTLGTGVATADAATWTEIPSGTTEEITAVEYRGGDQFWFTTANGKIFRRVGGTFQQEYSQLGVVFRDIEFDAAGSVGLAVGTNGAVARTTNGGADWAAVALPLSGNPLSETECDDTKHAAGDLDTLAIDGTGRAWIAGSGAQLWRAPGTGAALGATWEDANDGDGTDCKVPRDIDGMFFVPGSGSGYFIAKSFGQVYLTTNSLAGEASPKPGSAGNGFDQLRRLAGDPANPNRMWAVFPGGGPSYIRRTDDGWNSELDWEIANRDRREITDPHDVDYAGGTVVTAGDAGLIMLSTNGADFFFEDATGTLATQDWRAVSVADANDAALGGTNGKLAVTTTANVLPDIAPPTGTISGPSSVRAGQAATFTLNAADTGGSGINPASIRWTTAGLPERTGNPASFTFPEQGFATVTVSFADRAGNRAEASASVTIGEAVQRPAGLLHRPRQQAERQDQGALHPRDHEGHDHPPRGRHLRRLRQEGHAPDQEEAARHGAPQGEAPLQGVALAVHVREEDQAPPQEGGQDQKLRLTVSHPGNSVLRKSSKKLTLVVKK